MLCCACNSTESDSHATQQHHSKLTQPRTNLMTSPFRRSTDCGSRSWRRSGSSAPSPRPPTSPTTGTGPAQSSRYAVGKGCVDTYSRNLWQFMLKDNCDWMSETWQNHISDWNCTAKNSKTDTPRLLLTSDLCSGLRFANTWFGASCDVKHRSFSPVEMSKHVQFQQNCFWAQS